MLFGWSLQRQHPPFPHFFQSGANHDPCSRGEAMMYNRVNPEQMVSGPCGNPQRALMPSPLSHHRGGSLTH